jgi:hypothetical protein
MKASAGFALGVAMVTLSVLCGVRALGQTHGAALAPAAEPAVVVDALALSMERDFSAMPAGVGSVAGSVAAATPTPPVERTVVVDGVTVTIKPDSGATQADVDAVRDNIATAVAGSAKMKALTIAGGQAHSNKIDVHVHRDDPAVDIGEEWEPSGEVHVDRGDIEEAGNYLQDSATPVAKLKAALETMAVAHEMSHTSGTPDPDVIQAESTIAAELGTGCGRDGYCECRTVVPTPAASPALKSYVPYTADGAKVDLRLTDFLKARGGAGKYAEECCPVGGIAEFPNVSGSSETNYALLAGLAAALVALAAGAWYAKSRLLR